MKKSLIFFLFLTALFSIINFRPRAKSVLCHLSKDFKDVSTKNILSKYNYEYLKNVEKICTNDICTYNLDNNISILLKKHENSYLANVKDFDMKETLKLKGINISKIYFKGCI